MDSRTASALFGALLLITSVVAPAAAHGVAAPAESDISQSPTTAAISTTDQVDAPIANDSGLALDQNDTRTRQGIPTGENVTNVTLITGQTVHVATQNGTTRYYTQSEEPMYTVRTANGVYVIPEGVDFDTFDPTLFNVKLLVNQGLTDAQSGFIPLIVSDADGDSQSTTSSLDSDTGTTDVLDSVSAVSADRCLELIDAVSTHVSKANAATAYQQLRDDSDVAHVTLDIKYHVLNAEADSIVNGDTAKQDYNVSGKNITVAVIDSGINQSHPDLNGSKVVDQRDFVDSALPAEDEIGHGTHVAATIAGDGDVNKSHSGIAPNATLVDARVFGTGGAPTSRIIDAMQYARNTSADIISMSLGGPTATLRSNSPYSEAVNKTVAKGIPVVVAAGNSKEYMSVGSPGIVRKAITVGATDTNGSIASFSSRGPTPRGFYLKPDVVAPGVGIVSANADYAGSGDYYVAKSGTSMATPVTSGVVALMLSKNPNLTPSAVKSRLISTADPISSAGAYTEGAGRINATEALEATGVNSSDAPDADIVVEPGTTDFGRYTSNTTTTRTITVSNYGESNVTLDINATVQNIVNPGEGDATVSLNKSTLTLASGEQADVQVTVETGTVVGAYSGRISFNASDATAIFGFARAYEVTVKKSPLGSQNVSGDPSLFFAENDGPFQRTAPLAFIDQTGFSGGNYTRYLIANGTYNVLSTGMSEDTGDVIVTSKEVTINGSTTVTLDEDNTVKRSVDVQNATTTNRYTSVFAVEHGANGTYPYYGDAYFMSAATSGGSSTVYSSTDADLTLATTRFLTTGSQQSLNASEVYYLRNVTTGVNGSSTWTVDPQSLSQTDLTYNRPGANTSYNVTFRDLYGFPLVSGSIGSQTVQSVYTTSDAGLFVSAHGPDWNWKTTPQFIDPHDPDWTIDMNVARHPFTGYITKWDLSGGDGTVTLVPQNPQGLYAFQANYHDATNDTVSLWINGTKQGAFNTTASKVDLSLDLNESANVSIRTTARNGELAQSSRTVATYNASYEANTDNAPPRIWLTSPQRLNATSVAPNGTTELSVYVADETNLSSVVVQHANASATTTPFDGDASNWQNGSLEEVWSDSGYHLYEATINTTGYAGNVSIAVKAVDNDSNVATTTTFDGFEVHDTPPKPAFFTNNTGPIEVGETIAYNGSQSWDNLGIDSHKWTFGDNTTKTSVTVTHTYDQTGTYTLNYTVTDTRNNTRTLSTTIDVVDTAPNATLSPSTQSAVANETTVTLSAAESSDIQGITEYRWDVDGDSSIERTTNASNPSIEHTYDTVGTYNVTVVVVDTKNQTANASTTIDVVDTAPTATLSSPTQDPVAGETSVTLSAAGSSDNIGITEYRWDVDGDGSIERTTNTSNPMVNHTYSTAGTYEPAVIVVDTKNQTTTAVTSVSVREPDTNDGDSGGSSGGFTGGSDDTSDSTTTTESQSNTTQNESESTTPNVTKTNETVTVTVHNLGTNKTITADLTNESEPNETVDITAMTLSLEHDTNVSSVNLTITEPQQTAPTGTPDLDAAASVSYFTAESSASDAAINQTEIAFTVDTSALPNGTAPADVVLYRYHDGEWTALETEYRSGDTYVATTPGFSAFAVGVDRQQVVNTTTVTTKTTTTTPATTVGPADTTTTPATTVGPADTTETPTSTTSTSAQSPGFGLGVSVLATLLAGLLLRRRR